MPPQDKQEKRIAPRGRGRPPAAEPGTNVHTWLRESEYDRLIACARRQRISVSSYVRRLVILRLPQE
jgi:hypothetical protein